MYKIVVKYTFSDNDTRASFEDLMSELGFDEGEDQSTYVLRSSSELTHLSLERQIKQWSKDDDLIASEGDFVRIYYASYRKSLKESRIKPYIGTSLLKYDENTDGLVVL